MSPVEPVDTERFRGWIARRLGLQFDESKRGFLAEVLVRHASLHGKTSARYLDTLEGMQASEGLRALAAELTVPETYFFRHFDQFRAFAEIAVPERLAARLSGTTMRVLSAGCASGEEPYSLAILLRERVADANCPFSIRAIDINPAMLEKAVRGRYTSWAMRETPQEIRQRWFRNEGPEIVLDDRVCATVVFEECNLAAPDAQLWSAGSYDIVFCRNVLMYFTLEQAQMLVARLTRALAPGGYLFLGHAETLRGLSNEYVLHHTHRTFYYQRKGGHASANAVHHRQADLRSPVDLAPTTSAPDAAWATTWIETVQRSSDRIHALTRQQSAAGPEASERPGRADEPPTAAGLQLALELLKQERFAEALDLLSRLPSGSTRDLDIVLLRAVLLTHTGQLAAAEQTCSELLERDELNTGGHYLLALCRESAGDRQGAVEHDQVATYLDPGFAMPRLHQGLMARRAGDRETARRELNRALVLLQREDVSRLLLFGGGFGREALMTLCRAELRAVGDVP